MEWCFLLGLFTGSLIAAAFAAWAAYHERKPPQPDTDYVTPASLLDQYTDVSRFCEHGGLAGPGARVTSDRSART